MWNNFPQREILCAYIRKYHTFKIMSPLRGLRLIVLFVTIMTSLRDYFQYFLLRDYFQYLPRLKLLVRNEKVWKNIKNNSKNGISNQKLFSSSRIIVRL